MTTRPPMIRTDHTNPFAHNTLKVRIPRTIRDVQEMNPNYPASIQRSLNELAEAIERDSIIPPLEALAPDVDEWWMAYAQHDGHTWLNTDWFFAEIYFYRLLIEKTRWWETGRDPFAPKKAQELSNPELWSLLGNALELGEIPIEERLYALIHSATWGNRIDLSFAASLAHGNTGSHDDLLVDDSTAVVSHLMKQAGSIHLVTDNTGTELAMDMALVDALLDQGRLVVIHLKMHPTFVSDATVADLWTLIHTMEQRGGHAGALAVRLHTAIDEGRLRLAPDFYWNSSILLWDLTPRLRTVFEQAALVMIKGDANYRQIVGDVVWSPDTPFTDVVDNFPAPLLAMRTLKSDPIAGLPKGIAERLDTIDKQWRVNGKRGLIQYRA